MLRDIPSIVGLMVTMFALFLVGMVLYMTDTEQNATVTAMNTMTRTSAINHVDMASRVDTGHFYLNQNGVANVVEDPASSPNTDFESSVLTEMSSQVDQGAEVRFDYVTRTGSRSIPVAVYTYDGEVWTPKVVEQNGENVPMVDTRPDWRPMTAQESVEAIRIQYREPGNKANASEDVDNPDYWSYQSTVELDRSDFVESLMASDS